MSSPTDEPDGPDDIYDPPPGTPLTVTASLSLMGVLVLLMMVAAGIPLLFAQDLREQVGDVENASMIVAVSQGLSVLMAVVTIVLLVVCIWFVLRGARWARMFASVISVVIIGAFMMMLASAEEFLQIAVFACGAITAGAVVVMLWLPPSHPHFAKAPVASD